MNGMINGTIKLSSPLREVMGSSEVSWELPQGATVSSLIEYLKKRFPEWRQWTDRTLIIVNGRYATTEASLQNGDEVTILPFVSGG